MARRVAMVLLWVSMLAVPLKTVAGAAMLLCISHGHGMALSLPDGHPMQQAATAQAPEGDQTMMMGEAPDGVSINCPGEAVCHPSAGVLPGRFELSLTVAPAAPGARLSAQAVRFLTSGPERPPRSSPLA